MTQFLSHLHQLIIDQLILIIRIRLIVSIAIDGNQLEPIIALCVVNATQEWIIIAHGLQIVSVLEIIDPFIYSLCI